MNPQSRSLPSDLEAEVVERLRAWDGDGASRRLWDGDATLWTGRDEAKWLGWLRIVGDQIADPSPLARIREDAAREGFTHAVVLGMGGSSLCPYVLGATFGRRPGHPALLVLDSTDPGQVGAIGERIDPTRTLFIVSSKSGSTLEPNIFRDYFLDRARRALGAAAGSRFVAITDPGSALEAQAKADGFRAILPGVPSIGGRYSALSNFGLAPGAVMGMDTGALLREAHRMVKACGPGVPAAENPGVVLGTILGAAARRGIDKITFVASQGIRDFGAWLEQLIAESTGKEGKGIIPVDREGLGAPEVYGDDRLFVHLRLEGAVDPEQDAALRALETAGRPVLRIALADTMSLGQEFFRWEIATAVAGSVLGINPFDQPDVEAAKVAARALTSAYETQGMLPSETPLYTRDGIALYADGANAEALRRGAGASPTLEMFLRAHLGRIHPGNYFAILAWLPMSDSHEEALQAIRHAVRDRFRVATSLGFGPRFLHSTGQAYKGGPNSGVFLQITCDDARDLPVPGHRYSFGVVKAAQARGDFQVLGERKRRALRVHLPADVPAGLRALEGIICRALA